VDLADSLEVRGVVREHRAVLAAGAVDDVLADERRARPAGGGAGAEPGQRRRVVAGPVGPGLLLLVELSAARVGRVEAVAHALDVGLVEAAAGAHLVDHAEDEVVRGGGVDGVRLRLVVLGEDRRARQVAQLPREPIHVRARDVLGLVVRVVALGAAAHRRYDRQRQSEDDRGDDHADQQLDQRHATLVAQAGDHGATAFTGADSP
jgi:hypothetical protein